MLKLRSLQQIVGNDAAGDVLDSLVFPLVESLLELDKILSFHVRVGSTGDCRAARPWTLIQAGKRSLHLLHLVAAQHVNHNRAVGPRDLMRRLEPIA